MRDYQYKKIKEYISNICIQYNAEVVNFEIEFMNDSEIENALSYCSSPDEFIWMIDHSVCVLTDSFHATIFSILFSKPFVVFERRAAEDNNHMESRIETLLQTFHLECFSDDIDNPTIIPTPYDWKEVQWILNNERNKSLHFLRSALEI